MSWVLALLLAALAFAAVVLSRSEARTGWAAVGAAVLLGLAGYALQARPDLPGSPRQPVEISPENAAALVEMRREFAGEGAPLGSKWVVIADGMARHGQFAEAAEVLRGAVAENPRDSDAWVALANALVGHAGGTLSPAALHAFRQAAKADPRNPAPAFFLGLALIQSGRADEGRALWASVLANAPADAPWRETMALRLGRLDQLIAAQQAAQANR